MFILKTNKTKTTLIEIKVSLIDLLRLNCPGLLNVTLDICSPKLMAGMVC